MRVISMAVLLAVFAFDECFAQQAPPPGHQDTKTAEAVVKSRIISVGWQAAKALATGAEARVAAAAGEAALKNPYGAAAAILFTPSRIAHEELGKRPAPPPPPPPPVPPAQPQKGPERTRGAAEGTRIDKGPSRTGNSSVGGPAHEAAMARVGRTAILLHTDLLDDLYACSDPNGTFERCRSAILRGEGALNLENSSEKELASRWQKDLSQGSIPKTCTRAGSEVFAAWSDYLAVELQVIVILKGVDPNSRDSMLAFAKQFQPVMNQEDVAIARVRGLPPLPKECVE